MSKALPRKLKQAEFMSLEANKDPQLWHPNTIELRNQLIKVRSNNCPAIEPEKRSKETSIESGLALEPLFAVCLFKRPQTVANQEKLK